MMNIYSWILMFLIKDQTGFEGTQNPLQQVLEGPETHGFCMDPDSA